MRASVTNSGEVTHVNKRLPPGQECPGYEEVAVSYLGVRTHPARRPSVLTQLKKADAGMNSPHYESLASGFPFAIPYLLSLPENKTALWLDRQKL